MLHKLCCWLHRHTRAYAHAYESGHLVYFAMVAAHAPYQFAAAILCVFGAGLLVLSIMRELAE